MKTKLLLICLLLSTALCFSQTPVNDECAIPDPLTVTTTLATQPYDNTNATPSLTASCDDGSIIYNDVWYAFTMPVTGRLDIINGNFDDRFTIYDTCFGTEVSCGVSSSSLIGLIANQDYLLRVASPDFSAFPSVFDFQAVEVLNDECIDASIIATDIVTTFTQINYNNTNYTNSVLSSCDNAGFTWLDQWYSVTMPVDGNLRISNAYGNDSFALYDACSGTEIACGLGSEFFFNLTQDTNYLLKVASRNNLLGNRSFRIQAFATNSNDDCNAAITLPIITTNTINTSYNNAGSTLSVSGSCENNTYTDQWFEFTMPVTGNVRITGTYGNDSFTLYDACNGTELQCGFGNEYYYNLQQNTNYKLRVASRVDLIAQRSFNIQAFEPNLNDECNNATTIAIETANTVNTVYNNAGSTLSVSGSCENNTYTDQWFEFTMPVTGNVRITGTYGNDSFTLYDACSGTELQCGFGNEYYYNLQQNTNYKLRVASRVDLIAQRSFNIQAFEPNLNDECNNATTIAIETANTVNTVYNNAGSTLSISASCENNTYTDQWFEFTMPVTGNVRITGTYGNDSFTLYDACSGTELQCGFGNEYYYNLQLNTNYKLRVASRVDLTAQRSFNIQAFEPNVNDECSNATTLAIETANTINTTYNNAGSTLSISASCENGTYTDMWFDFTMPVSGNAIISGAYGNDIFTLYDACSGAEIQCGFGNENYLGLIQNTNYKLKVASRVDLIATRSFNIQAFFVNPNDDCNTSTNIAIETANSINIAYNNSGSIPGTVQGSCENTAFTYNDIWYNFTMPVNGNVFITNAYGNDSFTLYDACSGSEIQCGFGTERYINLNQNTNYVLRVASRVDLIDDRSFNIQAFQAIPNQTCATATTIQIANIGNCATQNNIVDMRGASPSTGLSSCVTQSQEYYDAWYTFQSSLTGNISLTTSSASDNYALYDACNGSEIVCFNNDGSLPVVLGNTYYLQLLRQTVSLVDVTFCLEAAPEVALGIVDTCETLPNVTISPAEGNANDWVPILDTNGNIAAAINANGNDLGIVSSTLFIDMVDARMSGTQPYLRREVSITPENQPVSDVLVRLFVLQDEMDDLILADANMVNYLFLDMMKVSGSGCTNGYTGGGDFIQASSNFYGSDYYSEFTTDSFSVFYPTSTNLDSTLFTEIYENTLGLSIYPTVSNGIINIKTENNLGDSKLSIFDLNGRLIKSKEVNLSSNPVQINLENTSKGLYFLKLENNGNTKTQKIILK